MRGNLLNYVFSCLSCALRCYVALQCNNIRSLYACTRQRCRVFAYLLLLLICCNRNRCVFYPTLRMCLSETPLDGNSFLNFQFCPSSPERTKKRQNSALTTHHLFCLQHFGLNIRQREDLKSQKMCQMTWRIFLNILEYFWRREIQVNVDKYVHLFISKYSDILKSRKRIKSSKGLTLAFTIILSSDLDIESIFCRYHRYYLCIVYSLLF